MKDNVILEVKNVEKFFYGNKKLFQKDRSVVKAVNDVSFTINEGETFGIVGESGCGKSTLGRTVIRLLNPTSGQVLYKGTDLATLSGEEMRKLRQEIQIIFQDPFSSLDPRMTVGETLLEALESLRPDMSREEKSERIRGLLSRVGLREDALRRYPHEFSGGQRQRVAMGRAIVRNPKVFLMDEPLSNLDAKLRVQMRSEIASLHNRLKATIIYVTHDQTEAMTLGTRIVVLKDGVIMQVDSPQKLYNEPNNLFVAGFIGSPQMNFIDAVCKVEGERVTLNFEKTSVVLPPAKAKKLIDGGYNGKTVVMGIRPEDIGDSQIEIEAHKDAVFETDVTGYELLGSEVLLYFNVAGTAMTAKVDSRTTARMGDHITLAIDPEKIHCFDKETELTITN